MFPAVSGLGHFTEWTLGFRQSSFHHAIRASASVPPSGFAASDLSEHAVFPSGFRFQVDSVAQESHALSLPCCTGIKLRRDAAHILAAVVGEDLLGGAEVGQGGA